MVFPVVIYGCDSWTLKKAECQRIDAFELWCWRRLLRVPWTAWRSNQSILKEISPGCSLEGLMLKLKPILWPPDVKNWLIWKDSDAGKDWRQKEKRTTEDEMVGWHHQLDGPEFEQAPWVGDGKGGLVCCGPYGCKESDTTKWLNWAALPYNIVLVSAIFQHESAIGVHMSPPSWTSFPPHPTPLGSHRHLLHADTLMLSDCALVISSSSFLSVLVSIILELSTTLNFVFLKSGYSMMRATGPLVWSLETLCGGVQTWILP